MLSFCYPFGDHSPELTQRVRETPHLLAVTTDPGLVTCSTDPMLLPRLEIRDGPVEGFRAMVEQALSVVEAAPLVERDEAPQ